MSPSPKPDGALRVLFLGDVCAEPGRKAVEQELAGLRQQMGVDFVIANGENAAGGYGITPALADGLLKAGVAARELWRRVRGARRGGGPDGIERAAPPSSPQERG